MPIEKTRFSPQEILADIQNLFAPQAAQKGLRLYFSLDENVPASLEGDSARIRQILLNLVGNALKFTELGSVTFGLRRSAAEKTYAFFVQDTGPGIFPEQIERIFSPFTQADSSISRRHGGAGLGLSISRRLAELMSGTLTVQSDPGHGAEFILSLVLEESTPLWPHESMNGETRLDAGFASRHPLKILAVEDDRVNLKLILTLLQRLGYPALHAKDGVEAVALYRKEHPTCILMDLQMPEMDGIEATEKIRALEQAFPKLPPAFILALTANIVPNDRQRCFDAGMNEYLNKPIKIAALAALLARASARN